MNWLGELVQREIAESDIVLDLGCGIMQAIKGLKCKNILACDIWAPYLEQLKTEFQTVQIDMSELNRFIDNSYDVVICLDVVEHLEKALALNVLDELKRVCRKKAIVYTPRIFKYNLDAIDNAWGLGHNPHQQHKCLVKIYELRDRGYTVDVVGEDNGLLGVYSKWS